LLQDEEYYGESKILSKEYAIKKIYKIEKIVTKEWDKHEL